MSKCSDIYGTWEKSERLFSIMEKKMVSEPKLDVATDQPQKGRDQVYRSSYLIGLQLKNIEAELHILLGWKLRK